MVDRIAVGEMLNDSRTASRTKSDETEISIADTVA